MTFVRSSIWSLSTVANPWHPVVLAYAKAVKMMQSRPLNDPTSWRYQAAIHGLAATAPPPGAPWNSCQHSTWYFLPWHRMYLATFEEIVRAAVIADGGPADWALPYWDYSGPAPANTLPLAFRSPTLPDNTPNPLFVAQRRGGSGANSINGGAQINPVNTSSTAAMASTVFTTPSSGFPVRFGGPATGFAHFGPAPGLIENQPHNIMHVVIGGTGGLMTDPDTAALDPIFWLHHANIDRLWEMWRVDGGANPTPLTWRRRTFRLRNSAGAIVKMRPESVVDTVGQLDYTYDSIPVVALPAGDPVAMTRSPRPKMIGRSDARVQLGRAGAQSTVAVDPIAGTTAAASASGGDQRRVILELADIEGTANPGVVYGVYVNLPAARNDGSDRGRDEATLELHRVGLVSLFGIEHSTAAGSPNPQPLRYRFDITDVVDLLRVTGDVTELSVELLPLDPDDVDDDAAASAAAARPAVTVGTIAVHTG